MKTKTLKTQYQQSSLNAPIKIDDVTVRFKVKKRIYKAQGHAIIHFEPSLFEEIVILSSCIPAPVRTAIVEKRDIQAFCGDVSLFFMPSSDDNLRFNPSIMPIDETNHNTRVSAAKIVFNLLNFPLRRSKAGKSEKFQFPIDPWVIRISPTTNAFDLNSQRSTQNGIAITHIGELRKKDHSDFNIREARDILDDFNIFLRFISAKETATFLPFAVDRSGEIVWREISMVFEESSITGADALLDLWSPKQLGKLCTSFVKLMKDTLWRSAICEVLEWYIEATKWGHLNSLIIMSQVALERLAWSLCVRDKSMLSPEGFKNLRASDQLRLLFSSLEISSNFDCENEYLCQWAKINKIQDIPQFITEMRNSAIHPLNKNFKGEYGMFHEDCWMIAIRCIRQVLVAICHSCHPNPSRLFDLSAIRRKNRKHAKSKETKN